MIDTQVAWPVGILGVVQTPFTSENTLDWLSLDRLIAAGLAVGVDGFLVPALASENAYLSFTEKIALATTVQQLAAGQAPVFWGAGSSDPAMCIEIAGAAERAGAAGCLIAVPPAQYVQQTQIVSFFKEIAAQVKVPLMIQDWDPQGAGMSLETILQLREQIASFRFIKIETIPAGPKYTAVLEATEGKLHVSGGWAVGQMIEALDRGVHAMIPECSMLPIYKRIDQIYRSGQRQRAQRLFYALLPVLSFTNQSLDLSIRFFKRLLQGKGIFTTDRDRLPGGGLDHFALQIADELIERVLWLESELPNY